MVVLLGVSRMLLWKRLSSWFWSSQSHGKALIAAEALPPAASFVARGSMQGG